MDTVANLLETKGTQTWSIAPDESVFSALELMAEKKVGALIVMEGDKLVGMISERDYARKVILKDKASKSTTVREIMTSEVYTVTAANTIHECMAIMTTKTIRHLPVMENGRVSGIISIGDVVKAVISEQEFIIDQLENFITGR